MDFKEEIHFIYILYIYSLPTAIVPIPEGIVT
jgi:hypothetical protein